ncbi:MAG: zinc ribbon domain-containing protein [Phycisphaeraceae bacterium]|nr:zinc ribbon domain-containing protein [Phycisphaeraceae bacterium]
MPTYEYHCNACDKDMEIFHSMTEPARRVCPECGKKALERLISAGGAVIFKGSGFYQTDYRTDSYKKAAEKDKPAEKTGDSNAKGGSCACGKSDGPCKSAPAATTKSD